jgi:dTDP-4-dehydrorhamnose reductase
MVRVLVTGAAGQVGSELMRTAWPAGWTFVGRNRSELDIASAAAEAELRRLAPDIIVNAAAYTAVDRAEGERDAAEAANCSGPGRLARYCSREGIPLLHLSTDYVFDGSSDRPYREDDAVRPINVYGATKEAGERAIRDALDRHIIVRTSWIFGAAGHNFVKAIRRRASSGGALRVVADQYGRPTPAKAIAQTLVRLAELAHAGTAPWGTFQYAGATATSWHGFAQAIVALGEAPETPVEAIATEDYPTPARRPKFSVLDLGKIEAVLNIPAPDWRDGLSDVIAELTRTGRDPSGSASAVSSTS